MLKNIEEQFDSLYKLSIPLLYVILIRSQAGIIPFSLECERLTILLHVRR